jgi:hypothetical protein
MSRRGPMFTRAPSRGLLLVTAIAVAAALLAPSHALAAKCDDCPDTGEGGGGPGGGLARTTVTGTFRYADTAGLRPIAYANVEVWRFANHGFGVWTWAKDATVVTDQSGMLSTSFEYGEPGIIYALRVTATNYAAVVWPNDAAHTVPFHEEPGEPTGSNIHRTATMAGQTLDFSFDFTDAWTPQHFNIAETVRRGYDFAVARRDPSESDQIEPINVQPTSVTGSWYNPTVDTLVINSASALSDLIVLHEYGHYLEDRIGSFPWLATRHNGCLARDAFGAVVNSAEHAWMEGFSNWFAQAVAKNDPSAGLTGTSGAGTSEVTSTVGTLEAPPACSAPGWVSGDMVEDFVDGALWDLTDGGSAAEPADTVANAETTILQIMDHELDVAPHASPWPSINTFRSAWNSRGLDAPALNAILVLNRIPVPTPPTSQGTTEPAGPDDKVCLHKPWTPGC